LIVVLAGRPDYGSAGAQVQVHPWEGEEPAGRRQQHQRHARHAGSDESSGKGGAMADLIAIGYPDEATAQAAADEARRLAHDLIIQPDAIAVISRDKDGSYHVTTNHHMVGAGATWGMFWGFLFGLLFFIPVFGLAIGAGMGALMGKLTKTSIDKQFQEQVRDMVKPGTSCLFLMLEKVTPDKAVEAMSKYGGTVLKTSLSKEDEQELQAALHGDGEDAQ
jgi:uncharacterized membrane protein